jgi:hypothetical protein
MLLSNSTGCCNYSVSSVLSAVHILQEGALQPVINLLSSTCPESQREAALLLGQFATQTPNDDGPGADRHSKQNDA